MSKAVKLYCDDVDITNSSFRALLPNIQKLIKRIIEENNFTNYEIIIDDLNTGGDNFLGILYTINIKGKTLDSDKEVNIFVKEKITLNDQNCLNSTKLYANEEFIYKDLSKVITNLQDKANIPPEDRFKIAKAYDETNNDAIILENLCKRGFTRYDRNKVTSLKVIELSIKELAKFHGMSFVIEKKMPEYYKEKIAGFDASYNFDENWHKLMDKILKNTANLFDGETKKKLEAVLPVWLEKIPNYHYDKTTRCTLCHGDYKNNNIMFRVIDGEPVELIIIDYQLLEYGNPIKDLVYFLFYGSDREFRREHLNDLKDLYFETLSRFLQYFEMDVEMEFPREKFEQIYKEWLDYGCLMCLFITVFMNAPDTGLDLRTVRINEIPYNPNEEQKKMIRELVEDFIDWGYL
ncbi:uncharacterized protein LOC124536405 [Vanessa cardui]|uniref:uncharacterized protein LOC124536405 n=1 Tax=Vanessa cardui TaxID=171605 RepID=UPI001F1353FD|nr:uncharacterized protein LOC124536405 [Vanessa cardui]